MEPLSKILFLGIVSLMISNFAILIKDGAEDRYKKSVAAVYYVISINSIVLNMKYEPRMYSQIRIEALTMIPQDDQLAAIEFAVRRIFGLPQDCQILSLEYEIVKRGFVGKRRN